MGEIERILDSVWNHALDASGSNDFRNEDGSLKEETYLRYKHNVIKIAKHRIQHYFEKAF